MREARSAPRLGLLSFPALSIVAALLAGCGPTDPRAVANAADAAAGIGAYSWLFEHDPSALVVVGLDARTVRTVAPDARTIVASGSRDDCARALRDHALLAVLARQPAPERARAEDCGYALYHDDGSIVVAPR